MDADTAYWEASGRIPPQSGTQTDGKKNLEREKRWVGVSPAVVSNGGVWVTGGGDLRLLPP